MRFILRLSTPKQPTAKAKHSQFEGQTTSCNKQRCSSSVKGQSKIPLQILPT